MKTPSQKMLVLKFLKDVGSITPLDALREFGIMRLAARIWELRKMGYSISKSMEIGENRYGFVVMFARYRLNE